MISLLLTSTLIFGDMDQLGSGQAFCDQLKNYKGHYFVVNSNGGLVKEAAIATQCIRQKDIIAKVLKAHSAATYMLHGMPWKCFHPKATISTHNVSDGTQENLTWSRDFFFKLNNLYTEWGVPTEKFMATNYAAMMTPFNEELNITVPEATYFFGGVVCGVEGE